MTCDAFCVAARVDEHECGSVLADQFGQLVVHLGPDLSRHHGFKRGSWNLDGEVALANVPGVDDRAVGLAVGTDAPTAYQETRDFLNGLLRCRQTDTGESATCKRLESLQRERKVQAALAAYHRVNFVDNDRARRREHFSPGFRSEQDVERFWRCHHDMRRALAHAVAFVLGRVARTHERSNLDVR